MTKIPCRMAALDLDGTLLNSDHIVTDKNCTALRELSKEGVVVVLVSGRMHQSILPISDQIGLENPIISYNGGLVKHAKTGEVFHHTPIAATTAMDLVDYCDERGLHLNFCLDDQLYIRMENPWSELYMNRTGVRATAVGDLKKLTGGEPTKMQVLDTPENVTRLLIEFQKDFGDRLYITRTQIEYIEFMNPKVSKGPALKALAAKAGISMDLVVAFGDGYNDESMMDAAGYSIAMGNAVEELKESADFIAESNDVDGVAQAVERLLLGGRTTFHGFDGDARG
ncbi:MAG: Cof-type HAD-IIB family hydrolase [Candidatus Poribacteria bacterium]|nr:Cof-type HAD-IIB family hydrolase [Candidatus Poribacteria bacterium]MDE0506876.1 Cof-type HAD-IIB family hydrolase [Candidatus Poribacteria bacterium]